MAAKKRKKKLFVESSSMPEKVDAPRIYGWDCLFLRNVCHQIQKEKTNLDEVPLMHFWLDGLVRPGGYTDLVAQPLMFYE